MKKMYELERAKVLILRETKGAFSDENLEAFFDFLIDNKIKKDYLHCADFVKDTFRVYLVKDERKEVRKLGLFYFIIRLLNEIKEFKEIKEAFFSFSNTHIKLKNKDEVKEQLRELGVDIENLKLRSDIEKILYVLLQEKLLDDGLYK
ncbi:hypothetical protein A7U28_05580 [Campylobacter upsaliensis]|nr:hypothetical protein [Campylobacter upsaliensis]EAK9971462.1 hypothetical protein [Campylobacter upsaliensis]